MKSILMAYFPYVLGGSYALLINLIAFIMYGVDKHRAQKKDPHRISESSLIWIAVFGGSIGAIMGMYGFHHKTQHKKFTILLPLIFVLQMAIIVYFLIFL